MEDRRQPGGRPGDRLDEHDVRIAESAVRMRVRRVRDLDRDGRAVQGGLDRKPVRGARPSMRTAPSPGCGDPEGGDCSRILQSPPRGVAVPARPSTIETEPRVMADADAPASRRHQLRRPCRRSLRLVLHRRIHRFLLSRRGRRPGSTDLLVQRVHGQQEYGGAACRASPWARASRHRAGAPTAVRRGRARAGPARRPRRQQSLFPAGTSLATPADARCGRRRRWPSEQTAITANAVPEAQEQVADGVLAVAPAAGQQDERRKRSCDRTASVAPSTANARTGAIGRSSWRTGPAP